MATTTPRPDLLVIVGATASGKSSLAIQVAKQFNGEVIAADSWTVYRHFDIGTSKPSKENQQQVRHYLLDVVGADRSFNAAKFKKLAETAIRDIQRRGKLPIMVGGTGLYIDSVLFDFGFLANVSAEERQRLNSTPLTELLDIAARQHIDLTGVDLRNKRRVIRAIEAKGQKPTKKDLRSGVLIVGLQIPGAELRKRVDQRTDQMIEAGLEKEVKELAERYSWLAEPMKGIGYREWREYFEGIQTLQETKNRIISATMNLAKRQRTWFKRNAQIHWFSSEKAAFSYISKVMNT